MRRNETAIISVRGYEILDSRGNPTVAATVRLADGEEGRAFVPSGASTGDYEAAELRDQDSERYNGKGVRRAVENINTKIGPNIEGADAAEQAELDGHMCEIDGTEEKSKLGANAVLAVSMAAARAVAESRGMPLYQYLNILYASYHTDLAPGMPGPSFNIVNGGEHADSGLDVQEFMIQPQFETVGRNLRAASEIYHALKGLLDVRGYGTSVGDEGGFAPRMETCEEAFETVLEAVEHAGYTAGEDCYLGIDAAAGEFYDADADRYAFGEEELTSASLAEKYRRWLQRYPLSTVEDPFAENDFTAWQTMRSHMSQGRTLVGDDLLVTNQERIRLGIQKKLADALLVKPNQVGTLTETLSAIALVYAEGWDVMVSHRSGETSDTFIADLAVACNARWIKAGAPARGERVAKYNRLLEIEHHGVQKANISV